MDDWRSLGLVYALELYGPELYRLAGHWPGDIGAADPEVRRHADLILLNLHALHTLLHLAVASSSSNASQAAFADACKVYKDTFIEVRCFSPNQSGFLHM